MNLVMFQNKLHLIQNYVGKLTRDNVPIVTQKILIKTYANDLSINLTNNMILEILLYNSNFYPTYRVS